MAVHELFSDRMKRSRGDYSDIYQYDEIPQNLRIQIFHIIVEAIGSKNNSSNSMPNQVYRELHSTLCKEYGVFSLSHLERPSDIESPREAENVDSFAEIFSQPKFKNRRNSDFDSVYDYFLSTESIEDCLDIIELTFFHINTRVRQQQNSFVGYADITADEAITELNERFRKANVGYEFIPNQIVRIDSQYLHSEVVKPALMIFDNAIHFIGARDEFLSAHSHYRNKKYKETLVDCLKAFESLLKSLCEKNNWEFNKNDTAKKLIAICLRENLLPVYMQEHFSHFLGLLVSGVPTIRNKEGGHGQGSEVKKCLNYGELCSTFNCCEYRFPCQKRCGT